MTTEIIRMTQSRYRQILETEQYMEENRDDTGDILFPERSSYPTADMIRENAVEERAREFLPWLIYYRDVYRPAEEEMEGCCESRQYIDRILRDALDVIPDEAMAPIDSVSPKKWGNMDLKRRCGVFRELVSYYSWREYDGFLRDLGWRRFMAHYRIKDRSGYTGCEKLTGDLLEVWEKLQAEPLPPLIS